ncbi:MAG: hypothetical protein PHP57_11745 [Sideroxydans sp.]|nr:hypothetical protein [Sideroxydans sp.]
MKKIVFLVLLLGFTQSAFSWSRFDPYPTPADQETQLKLEEMQRQLQQAEQAAEELRNEMLRSSIRTKNNIYLGVVLLAISGFVIYLISRRNKEKPMDENQKYGVVTMLVSFLLMLLALMISEGWNPQLDYLENFMNLLRIQLIEIKTERPYVANDFLSGGFDYSYLINLPTKYVALAFMSTAAYGLTSYLGITPAFRPWKKASVK